MIVFFSLVSPSPFLQVLVDFFFALRLAAKLSIRNHPKGNL